jgi:hypothetical protein
MVYLLGAASCLCRLAQSFSPLTAAAAAHQERQPNGRSSFAGIWHHQQGGGSGRVEDWLALAARADERLSPIDQPARAHADNPMAG